MITFFSIIGNYHINFKALINMFLLVMNNRVKLNNGQVFNSVTDEHKQCYS